MAAKAGAIRAGSRVDLLGNRLVVVAPKAAPIDALALDPKAFEQAIGTGKLATGEINTVPVGKYAKASLTKLGLWSVVEPRLAMTSDVRTALAFVARGEATLGIVYATDAAAEPAVKIVATFPDDSHPPILYPFALTAASHNAAAESFLAYLKSAAGRAFFAAPRLRRHPLRPAGGARNLNTPARLISASSSARVTGTPYSIRHSRRSRAR